MLAKGRATLYATTSRAKQLQKDYLQSMHAEDLAFSTSNKKKDAARKLQMKVEQHRKEQLEIERRKLIKETLRIERDRQRFLVEEHAKMLESRKRMLREELAQKAVEEVLYCRKIHQQWPKKGRTYDDIRKMLLQIQENQPSRTDIIHDKLIERLKKDRKEALDKHVRWRKKCLESICTVLIHSNDRNRIKESHKELYRIFQIDERRRRELHLWPLTNQSDIIINLNKAVHVQIFATCSILEIPMRRNNEKCLHLLCQMKQKLTLSVKTLLTCGTKVDVNATTKAGDTALHLAARCGSNDIIQMLIIYGANPRIKNVIYETPIFNCVKYNLISTMILLFNIAGGRDLLLDSNIRGITILHLATYSGYNLMVEQIIQWIRLGSQYKVINRNNEIDYEKKHGVGKCIELKNRKTGCYHSLIAVEGSRNTVSNHYYTTSAENGRLNLGTGGWKEKKKILKNSKDAEDKETQYQSQRQIICAVTKRGITPLMCACYTQNVELMEVFSSCMSTKDIAMVDKDGRSAADYARHSIKDIDDVNTNTHTIMLLDPMV